jgi:hypothetical protein
MRSRQVGVIGLVAMLAACGGGSAAPIADGPVSMGIVAGNHQVVPAGRDPALPQPVVAQVVRGPNGQVSLRLLDALLPAKAYAQTTVTGIPNQVVCFSAPDPKHVMRAEVACASSDALGKATFVLHTDSVAGVSRGQVAAALPTGTKITDSITATVMPGAASPTYRTQIIPILSFPATVPDASVQDAFGNAVAFRIVSDGRIVVQDTTVGSVGARTIVSGPDSNNHFLVELRGAGNVLVGHASYHIVGGQLETWIAAGVNATP